MLILGDMVADSIVERLLDIALGTNSDTINTSFVGFYAGKDPDASLPLIRFGLGQLDPVQLPHVRTNLDGSGRRPRSAAAADSESSA